MSLAGSFWVNRTVAVTGGAGFLGSHLCEGLVAAGARVLALDNLETGTARHLDSVRDRLRLVSFDVGRDDAQGVLATADVVFHLAAIANPRACEKDFGRTYHVNVEGTRHVLERCRPGARVIFLSGAMAYGEPVQLPMDEAHPLRARDPYALSKIMGECLTWAVSGERKLRATVVRNFTSYGPRQTLEYVIPRMITQALQQGRIKLWNTSPTRDFTYVNDTVRGLLVVAETEKLVGEVVNLGSGRETSIHEVARHVARLLGGVPIEDLNREVSGSLRQRADTTKLRRATGWEPRVPLEDGLARTITWFKRERTSLELGTSKTWHVHPTLTGGIP